MNTLRCLIVSVLICCITAYPNGAPRNICGRYVPGGHPNMGTPVANGPRTGPYSVTVIPRGNGIFEGKQTHIKTYYYLGDVRNTLILEQS